MRDELIIFDCDGVLVDSEPIANAVLAQHLTLHGLPTTTYEAMSLYKGRSMSSVLQIAAKHLGRPLPATFLDEMQAETYRAFETQLKAVEGAEALVMWVQEQGYQTCIASSGDYEKLDTTLGITGLKRYFDGRIFSAVDVQNGKPAPDLFLHACAAMQALPQVCSVIEDSQAGVTAALAAKMRVFAYGAFDSAPSVLPISHISEVKDYL